MPKVEIEGYGTVDAEAGARLVNVIIGAGVDIGHRCGGWAGCTTCRVEFVSGEPEAMTRAEKEKLEKVDLLGKVRLSCQIPVQADMRIRPLMLAAEQGWPDAGPAPEEDITPEPDWT